MKTDPKMDRHLDRIYPEHQHLFDAGELVQSLTLHPGWLHVTRLLEYEIATIDATLDGRDRPLEQAEYAMAHGRRSGLRGAQAAVDAIVNRADREYARLAAATSNGGAGSPPNGDNA